MAGTWEVNKLTHTYGWPSEPFGPVTRFLHKAVGTGCVKLSTVYIYSSWGDHYD